MKILFSRKNFNLFFLLTVLTSCNFAKSNSVYNSYLGDESLVLYLTFNGDSKDQSKSSIKEKKGEVLYSKDRFGNLNSSACFKDQHYLSYGDVLNSVFSGKEKRFSFSFWLKPFKNENNVIILAKNSDSNCNENERQFNFKLTKDNKIQFIWLYNNQKYNGYRIFESENQIEPNKWQNIILTYDGYSNGGDGAFRVSLFVNGKKVTFNHKESRGKLGYIENKKAHLAIGTMVSSKGETCLNSFFKGELDDLMVFNRVLTPNEVNQINSLKQ